MAVIENPIINSPFKEPQEYHELDNRGNPTGIKIAQRRKSTYLTPIPQPRKQSGSQLTLFDGTAEKLEENTTINAIRQQVKLWRQRGYPHVTRITRQLLEYWTAEGREKRLFYCQIEAMETAIYIVEAAKREKQEWIETELRKASDEANPGLYRMAFKMATGSGKTVVMAMLIAWQALNKFANPGDGRFSDAFLIVTPGVTIRDRLRVLLPGDPGNYYRERNLVPTAQFDQLHRARIIITNYHAFMPREIVDASSLTKNLLKSKGSNPFTETPGQMVRRVCRGLGEAKNIVVINDEAHHCYDRKLDATDKDPKGEIAKEVEERRVWANGIRAVQQKIGVRTVYDLSATPFFLAGSGYPEGKLFPWVVSDFALIDAIESGIVKIPRLPVADDAGQGDLPMYRNLWVLIRDIGARLGQANCLQRLGDVHLSLSENEAARKRYEEALPIYRDIGARLGQANCLQRLGDVHLSLGQYPPAQSDYKSALGIYDGIGNRSSAANTVGLLAQLLAQMGEEAAAVEHAKECIQRSEALGHPALAAAGYLAAGNVYETLKRYDDAAHAYDRAIALQPRNALFYRNRAIVAMKLLDLERAAQVLGQAAELQPAHPYLPVRQAELYALLGDGDKALAATDVALSRPRHAQS